MNMKSKRRSSGKSPLRQPNDLLFLLDESLDRNVAQALSLVRYNFITIYQAFEGRFRVLDSEVITWAKANNAVWVHADDRARKEHKAQLLAEGIKTLWIYRPKGIMSSKEQLRILSYVLPNLIDQYTKNPKQRHYKASAHGEPHRTRIRLEPVVL